MATLLPIELDPRIETAVQTGFAYPFCKRAFDLCLSALGLVILFPPMVVIAIAIRLRSPGPAIYRGRRVGRNGKQFDILKFRTMVVDAERLGGSCTPEDDVRIVGIGRWLRKSKLDELPQLINVLRGEMSLVGPRPELEEFTKRYDSSQRRVLGIKPGITDLATLWDSDEGALLAGEADPERAYVEKILPTKLRLQLEYLEKASFLFDLRILMKTAALVGSRAIRNALIGRSGR